MAAIVVRMSIDRLAHIRIAIGTPQLLSELLAIDGDTIVLFTRVFFDYHGSPPYPHLL